MKIVLYAHGLKTHGEKLKKMIHGQISGTQVKSHSSIEQISQLLCRPLNNVSVLVLLVTSRDELIQFTLMTPLFNNLRIILILPDYKKDLLSLGVKLKPSFFSDVHSNLQDIVSVLEQIKRKASN